MPLLAMCALLGAFRANAATQPNIIVIVSDDGGYNEFGFNAAVSGPGGTPTPNVAVTPNLDMLAQQSVVARQAYVQPVCGVSRAAFLTGVYNNRLGIEENLGQDVNEQFGFAAGQQTIASRLKDLGYNTGMVGKWHEGYVAGVNQPTDLGFDEYFGFLSGARQYYADALPSNAMLRGKTNVEGIWRTEGDTSKYDPVRGRYTTDAFGEESVNFINNHAHDANPFFLYTAFNSPHTPFAVKTSDYNQPQVAQIADPTKRTLAAMIYGMDRNVGDMMAALTANGIRDNTIIVFLNDNGGLNTDDNSPLRGFKGLAYEGGTRVPFMIQMPGVQPGVYNSPISGLDLVPTLINAAGGDASQISTDGVDLAPYLSGAQGGVPHQELFTRYRSVWSVRKGDFKLENSDDASKGFFTIFNVANDPAETTNLIGSSQYWPKMAELFRDLTGWEAALPKPQYGVLGADDRNKFDHFVFRNDLAATSNWSDANVWKESGNLSHNVTMLIDDAYANDIIEFTTRDSASYTANNNMTRMTGLVYMLNQVQFTGNFNGGTAQSGTLTGKPVLFVKDLNGQAPRIQLDATSGGAASFTFNLNNEVQLFDDLTITGNGTQQFVINGQIRDYYENRDPTITTPHNVTKSGISNVTLTANNTFRGSFTINGGQVHVNGASAAISGASGISVANGATLALDNGSISVPIIDNAAGGIVHVSGGTLKAPSVTGNLINDGGTLAAGSAPGLRMIGGSLQENAGILQMLIGGTIPGTNYDQLLVGNNASLGGTLSVQFASGFAPAANQIFTILSAQGGISGTFASLVLPTLSGGKTWQVFYGSSRVELLARTPGSPAFGDYNQNGVVDPGDYIVWKRSLGSTTNLAADGNGNGIVDTGDYTVWQRHFGGTLVSPGSGTGSVMFSAVPEPSTFIYALTAGVTIRLRCRRREELS
jgi:autotransporter-associated beta strand protein